ncbi:histidine--tRNA ligase [Candidatus Falkowbacteria bacterium]|nr:histidine--tRNA ligase [Candidatus Falkowbacteria bacterium]
MPRRKKEEIPHEEIRKIKTPAIVDGMRDVLPADHKYWEFVEREIRKVIDGYSFLRIATPILEKYELFNHTLFKQSGALEGEVFDFIDRGQKLILRPENAASIARAFISHNMANQPMPLKVYFWGPMFRQARGEANKWRQFTQAGFEIIGEKAPAIDAELIIIASNIMKNLGLETEVRLNSVGCGICRLEYSKALSGYLKSKRAMLCQDCRRRIGRDPQHFLACQNNRCARLKEDAPQTVDWLCDECRNHLFRVLEYLDELKIPYQLDSTLLSTFGFYSKTIFEINANGERGEKISLASGGRFDNLLEMLSGPAMPGAGFALGLERVIQQLKTAKAEVPNPAAPDVFLAQISEQARQKAFAFFEELRRHNFSIKANLSKANLKAQLEIAAKLGAKYVLILGQKEAMEGTVILRDMESGIQEVVNRTKVVKEIQKRLRDNLLKL